MANSSRRRGTARSPVSPRRCPGIRGTPDFRTGPRRPGAEIAPYAFRSFDRQFFLRDARVGDRNRPPLHLSHGLKQVYITGMLTGVIGKGPAVTTAVEIPDRHHFRGSYSGKDVIPLYRDADATEANVTQGLLERIGEAHGNTLAAERLFAYAYGVLAQPAYTERFWDELEQPPPRLPITKDAALFARVADHGERLLHLHTYGERFLGPGRQRRQGEARCTLVRVSSRRSVRRSTATRYLASRSSSRGWIDASCSAPAGSRRTWTRSGPNAGRSPRIC